MCAAPIARAVDPYESRQDREYRSLSGAISRAYSVPPPSTSSARPYSLPAYSSSSSGAGSSSGSSPSYSGGGGGAATPFIYESASDIKARFAEQAKAKAEEAAARKAQRALDALAEEAMWARISAADSRAANERYLDLPSSAVGPWEKLVKDTGGKVPLAIPPNRTFVSPRTEFLRFSSWARLRGAAAPWENMRAGQMCLLFQGDDAVPSRAFAFFSLSNPAWPEVQLGLGLCYLRGYGVAADPARARDLIERAVAEPPAGTPIARYVGGSDGFLDVAYQACRELAISYDLGRGLPADAVLAAEWYERAGNRLLSDPNRAGLLALKTAFWKRQSSQARVFVDACFAADRAGAPLALRFALFKNLRGTGDAAALYLVGALTDTKDDRGDEITRGRTGISYFLAAARLGHEPAARAFFSPATNGDYNDDLDGDPFWRDHAEFVRDAWPQWEKRWQAAVAAGDADAALPLAFYYSGARGNKPDDALARRYAALLPATTPAPQRTAVVSAISSIERRDGEVWLATVWTAFRADRNTIDLTRRASTAPASPADSARAAALRDEGNQLARTEPLQARDRWLAAAALGDLPAQVRLYTQARYKRLDLGPAYEKSLRARLETVAATGDSGAFAALAVLYGSIPGEDLALASANYTSEQKLRAQARLLGSAKPRYRQLATAAAPPTPEADYAAALAAARRETARWHEVAATWGLADRPLLNELILSDDEYRQLAARRAQILALAEAASRLELQLAVWEKTVDDQPYDPASDARYLQGYEAWLGYEKAARDPVLALDYFSQSTGLGHPLAPLALAFFHGSGYAGFPKSPALAARFRALADLRLVAMASGGDTWAQTFPGYLLVTGNNRRDDDIERPASFEWLPQDKERGMRWLQLAALDGASLPAAFDDASGQLVAWYIVQVYYNWETPDAYSRWKLIEEVLKRVSFLHNATKEEWTAVLAEARAIAAETPEMTRARTTLDAAVAAAEAAPDADTDPQGRIFAALVQSTQARLKLGWKFAAQLDAEAATLAEPTRAESWDLLARTQTSRRDAPRAAIGTALARALERNLTTTAAFEAALSKAPPDDRSWFISQLRMAAYPRPDSKPLQQILALAEKFEPSE